MLAREGGGGGGVACATQYSKVALPSVKGAGSGCSAGQRLHSPPSLLTSPSALAVLPSGHSGVQPHL